MLYPTYSESISVELFDHGQEYPIYNITLRSSDLRDYFDEPSADKCRQLMELLLDEMLVHDAVDECVRRNLDNVD